MLQGWILKIRRAETPGYRRLKSIARAFFYASMPLPGVLRPLFRFLYRARFSVPVWYHYFVSYFFRGPAFRARCESCGERLYARITPVAPNHTRIIAGDDLQLFGKLDVYSPPLYDDATLKIGDRVDIGHMVVVMAAQHVEIGSDVNIANRVVIADNDSHPRNAEDRIAGLGPEPEEVRPVKIGDKVWLGMGAFIGKGVTIGEGAIIAASSVVLTDVPAYCVAMGNPARVVVKDLDLKYAAQKAEAAKSDEPKVGAS